MRRSFIELTHSLHKQAERHQREKEDLMVQWLLHNLDWIVDGGHTALLAAFLRDVTRFASPQILHAVLVSLQLKASSNLILRAAKLGHRAMVAILVAFGARLGPALLLAAMNCDQVTLCHIFRSYLEIKRVLLCGTAPTHRQRVVNIVRDVRETMCTCMNVASVRPDAALLELLANLCSADPDLQEASAFATHFVHCPSGGPSGEDPVYDDEEDNYDDGDVEEDEAEASEAEE